MLCNLKEQLLIAFFSFTIKKMSSKWPLQFTSHLFSWFSFRKDYKWSITSGKDARSNHTIKHSLFDSVSCADLVEVFSRILQRLLFSNVVIWVKEWGSHPPFYNHKLLAWPLDWPLDPYYMPAWPLDWPLDPYYMPAQPLRYLRIFLSP